MVETCLRRLVGESTIDINSATISAAGTLDIPDRLACVERHRLDRPGNCFEQRRALEAADLTALASNFEKSITLALGAPDQGFGNR